tara:strand:+ start:1099 stop:1275 length:177 start_codon:yes stop_codon:yes gene_type:complete
MKKYPIHLTLKQVEVLQYGLSLYENELYDKHKYRDLKLSMVKKIRTALSLKYNEENND